MNTYYRAQSKDRSQSPFRAKPAPSSTRRFLFGFLDIVLVILLIAGVVYSLLVNPRPKIIVNSQSFHSLNDYQEFADKQFARITNRNKITFDDNSIVSAMRKKFPEITAVSTELPVLSERPTLRISVASASLQVRSSGTDYIVDSEGVVVAEATTMPDSAVLPRIIDQSGYKAVKGTQLLSATAVSFIRTVNTEVAAARIQVSSLTLPPVDQELDLRAKGQTYYVKFYMGGDVLTQTGQYLATRNHFNQAGQQPSEYLDVRVSGKVFYK